MQRIKPVEVCGHHQKALCASKAVQAPERIEGFDGGSAWNITQKTVK
ncbi:MAG TPA: hypothetical protein VKV18_10185 [Chthonomonas sp.]|nr:hypothetical protein [Chthonomonas sp.]HLI49043.1 hypothetical protein [Chthonomonas sp.]